ncbi:MAG TPA: transglycosylase domain-containing protein, partial [Egibacteraceae bacterium]|nr:transglycosylase domain-containing protein [Egibacteraceae bacterium]
MPLPRLALRLVGAVVTFTLVSTLLVLLFASLALAIDWEIPEGRPLYGPSVVLDRNGQGVARFAAEVDLTPVTLEHISPNLQHAVVATEDRRFYEHQGVDPLSVLRAVWNNVRYGGIREGGSTLTQQYVRNVFVGSERTLYRKVREALVALQLEKERTKEQILEVYLNRIYFGDGAYGAEAAALTYFGKHAADLTVAESALLASVLVSPSRLSPRSHPEGAFARRGIVLDEMVRAGFLPEDEAAAARAEPIMLAEPPASQLPAAPFFVEEVRRQVLDAYGPDEVYRGGLAIRTTLDLEAQFGLERQVAEQLPADPTFDAGVAAVVPATGDVLAAWGGRDFRASQVNLALNRDYGRQSGSTFKVFSLVTALEEGMTLRTTYPAPGGLRIADWSVGGGGCGGRCTLQEAIVRSINTVFAQVGRDVGVTDFTTMAHRLGVRSAMRDNDLTQVLGTSEVTPLDLASAFATFANDGVACPARVVLDVRRPDGRRLDPPDPRQPSPEQRAAWAARLQEMGYDDFGDEQLGRCYRAVAPSLARQMNLALEQVVVRGTGRNAQIGRPQAGKTGTTTDNTEAWFVSYTPQLSIGVAFFAPAGRIPLVGVSGCRGACQGGQISAHIWA